MRIHTHKKLICPACKKKKAQRVRELRKLRIRRNENTLLTLEDICVVFDEGKMTQKEFIQRILKKMQNWRNQTIRAGIEKQ